MMYISFFFSFVFGALYFGRLSFIYRHWLLYIYDIGGSWIVFVVYVYGFVFMAMCLWICVYGYGYVLMAMCMDVFLAMCMGIGS